MCMHVHLLRVISVLRIFTHYHEMLEAVEHVAKPVDEHLPDHSVEHHLIPVEVCVCVAER